MLNRVFYRILGVADNLYPRLSDFCFFTIIAGLPLQAVLWERRMMVRRLIIGISGASGFQYGVKALELLRAQDVETPEKSIYQLSL